MKVLVVALCLSIAACLSDFSVAPDAVVTCADTLECPRGHTCEEGRCEIVGGNRAPKLVLDPLVPTVGDIVVTGTVIDANDDDVTVTVDIVDGDEIIPAV